MGWEGDLEGEHLGPGNGAERIPPAFSSHDSPLEEELIEDRYAALQAESELARNEAWLTSGGRRAYSCQNQWSNAGSSWRAGVEPAASANHPRPRIAPGGIRAEGQHEFAPYSQLFTRYRQSK